MSERKPQTRKMWVLVDKELDFDSQLWGSIDGRLYKTKPIPSHKWLKPVRVVVTIQAAADPLRKR